MTVSKLPIKEQFAYSLIELMVVLGLIGIFSAVAIANLREMQDPVKTGASQLASFMKQTRSRAMSATQAVLIRPQTVNQIIALRADVCSAEHWQIDNRLTLPLPSGVALKEVDWELCFNSRGLPDDNIKIELFDLDGRQRTVEVMLGGAVRVY